MTKIINLTIKYPDKTICENFTTEIRAGELIGIFGPNGAGKTSFIKALLGLIPYQGNIIYEAGITKKQIGYLPQERYDQFTESYSVEGFLAAVAGNAHGYLPGRVRQERSKIQTVLATVQMESFAKTRLRYLSGGERKRVMLAALLMEHPRLLLLDEPLANLDLAYQTTLLNLLRTLCEQQGLAAVITAHEWYQLDCYLDKAILLGYGQPRIGQFPEMLEHIYPRHKPVEPANV